MRWTWPSSPSSSSPAPAPSAGSRLAAAWATEASVADQALHGRRVVDELLGGVEEAAGGLDHLAGRRLQVLDALLDLVVVVAHAIVGAPLEDHLQSALLERGVGDRRGRAASRAA